VEVAGKTALHLARFRDHFADAHGHGHGHERLSAVVRREVVAWRGHLASVAQTRDARVQGLGLAPATVNARLGHQSQRHIDRYTNPPEDIAAGYIERL
jgi:hypothetical protein